jgi:hypothetical protein
MNDASKEFKPTFQQVAHLRWVILKHQLMTRLNIWDLLLLISLVSYMALPLVKMFGQDLSGNSLTLSSSAPAIPTNVGAGYSGPFGQTQIFYFVIARFPAGATNPSQVAAANNTQGAQNLSATATVTVTWSGVSGAAGYDVLRSTTSAFPSNPSPGPYAVSINTSALSVTDNGSALSSYPPTGLVTIQAAQAVQTVNNLSNAVPFVNMTLGGASLRLALIKGAITASNCVQLAADGSGQLESSGAACGSGGGGGFYQTVLNNGSAVTQRDQLNFVPGTGISISNSDSSSPSRTTLTINATGTGTGDVVGPASATNNAIALYDGTTGKLILDSARLLPTGALAGVGQANTYTTGVQDFSLATAFVVPSSAAAAPTASGRYAYDSTATVRTAFKVGSGGATYTIPVMDTPQTNATALCAAFGALGNLSQTASNCVLVGQSNAWTTGAQDMGSATSLHIPTGAAAAPTSGGHIVYNSTSQRIRYGNGASTNTVATQGAASTSGDCVQYDANGALTATGAACASGTSPTFTPPYINLSGVLYGPTFLATSPALPAWAWINQGSATLTVTNAAQSVCTPAIGGAVSVNARMISAPVAPYTVTAQIIVGGSVGATPRLGLLFRESATTKLVTLSTFGPSNLAVEYWNSSTSFSATAINPVYGNVNGFKFYRIENTGAALNYSVSEDGIGYTLIWTTALTAFFTTAPDQIGFFAMNNATTNNVCTTLLSWSVT